MNERQVPNTQHCNEPQNEHKTNLNNYNAKLLKGKKKSSSSRIFGQKKNCDYRNQNLLII